MQTEISKNCKDLIYLVSCALHETAPEQTIVNEMELGGLYKYAKAHTLSAVTYSALELLESKTGRIRADEHYTEVIKSWRDRRDKAIRKTMLFDAERVQLLSEFEKHEIWYMPLKGIILKNYYPGYGMREMADNDILFDRGKRAEVREIFVNRGYEVKAYNNSNHDCYTKPPMFNFEMHVDLFSSITYPELSEKYKNIREMLIKDEDNAYGYHFSDEDYYIYEISHAYKHYSNSGTGIRTLADIYVLNRRFKDTLNWQYVDKELHSMGIFDYERSSKALAEKLFGESVYPSNLELTEADAALLMYHLKSSTYGTINNRINNNLHKMENSTEPVTNKTKFRYLLRRFFPSRQWCRINYPVVYKYPLLLPFFWVWRIVYKGIKNHRKLYKEWTAVKRVK